MRNLRNEVRRIVQEELELCGNHLKLSESVNQVKNFKQFVNENQYRDNAYKIGEFLKQRFPNVKFIWDEDSKGWWTTDERFLNKYSSERTSYNYKAEEKLKRAFMSQNYGQKLIVISDFDIIQFTID